MSYRDEEFVLNNMGMLLAAMRASAGCEHMFFQLERVFFYAFNRSMGDTIHYADESVQKTIDRRALSRLAEAISEYAEDHGLTDELIEVRSACEDLGGIVALFHAHTGPIPEYRDFRNGEEAGTRLCALLRELLLKAFPAVSIENEAGGLSSTA
ncbi:MAG: hypothetical protein GF418_05585 [Chitinivibrionales bacterium]|nr:hypothetical protein [Chitinivibrionales bacterium]MBD3395082.1 hypothetical protein [Chitinivibrionales bacterium]